VTPGTLDDRYLRWLYDQVANAKTRKGPRTYWKLFEQLFNTEFVWFVLNDDNRAEDGKAIRAEWVGGIGDEDIDPDWLAMGCSFLELLIGLSRRLAFEAGNDGPWWFWELMRNLGLSGYHDRSDFSSEDVEDVTYTVIWRTYDDCGRGGLFPLQSSDNDQRQVEIWYQLSEYLLQRS
jgi:hypothetical protein